jgi:hypothetical protein
VHEAIARLPRTFLHCEAAMSIRQLVSKITQKTARVLRCVWLLHPVMKMDLGFSPTCMAMVRQNINQSLVILLGWIKVGVHKRTPSGVSPPIYGSWIFVSPVLQSPFLFETWNGLSTVSGD